MAAEWRAYEQYVLVRLRHLAGENADIRYDVALVGRISQVELQVDILVEPTSRLSSGAARGWLSTASTGAAT